MNTNLLAISNVFAATNVDGPDSANNSTIRKSKQFSSPTPDNAPFTKARGTITVENTLIKGNNRLKNEMPNEFIHTFQNVITTNVPQKAENSRNATKKTQTLYQVIQPSIVQLWLAQYSLNVEHGKEGVAQKVEPKAGYELAQLLANSRPEKSPSGAGIATHPQISKPVQIMDQTQIGPKNTPFKIFKAPLSTDDIPSNESEKTSRVQMPETRPLPTKGPGNEKSGERPHLTNIRAQNRITTANGKPEAVLVSKAFGSLKTPPLVDEGLPPQVLADNDSELTGVSKKPAITGKSVVPDSQKVPEQNPNLSPVQDKPSGLQPKAVGIGLRKSPLTAEEGVGNRTNPAQQGQILPEASTDDKATAAQRRTGTLQLTEPMADDGIEQGDNFTGKSLSQKLNNPQLQVSTGPVKGQDGSASSNNADSGFEQILSGNNTTAYVEEQTTVFPDAIKTDNLLAQTSSSDVSASITEQILESINLPSSQQAGTQQITIRLNPPELGKVFIKFEEQENQITGLLEISKAQTRYEVERALPQIIQNLADSGIQIRRLEVMLTNQNEQQSYRDELLQDGTFQQNRDFPEGSNPDSPGTLGTNDPGTVGNNSSFRYGLEPQVQITDNSINVLI